MANLWMDSCARYASGADALAAGYTSTSTPAIDATGGRWGEGAIQLGGSNTLVRTFAAQSTGAIGFVAKPPLTGATTAVVDLREGTTVHLRVAPTADGHIELRMGTSTILGTTAAAYAAGSSYCFQLKYAIANSPSGSAELWIDDVKVIDVSGVDTQNGGTGNTDNLFWNVGATRLSEIYINSLAGGSAINNGLWGSYRLQPRRATAAGNYAQWTPLSSTNVSNVDDSPANDGDTTYNSSSTANQIDTYQLTSVTPTGGTVAAIRHDIVARKDDAGVRTIAPVHRQNGNDRVGTSQNLTTTYVHYSQIYETNPDTGVAFTVSEMRSTTPEFGYKLIA